jgi:hypothetical protein
MGIGPPWTCVDDKVFVLFSGNITFLLPPVGSERPAESNSEGYGISQESELRWLVITTCKGSCVAMKSKRQECICPKCLAN